MNSNPFEISDCIAKYLRGELSDREKEFLFNWRNINKSNEILFQELVSEKTYEEKIKLYQRFNKRKNFDQIETHISKKQKRITYSTLAYTASIAVFIVGIFFLIQYKTSDKYTDKITSHEIKPGEQKAILTTSNGNRFDLTSREIEFNKEEGIRLDKKSNTLIYSPATKNVKKKQESEHYNTLYVPKGGEYHLILSDGTKVWLNSSSEIKYPTKFLSKKRIVKVSGEAYFEVAKNLEKPFIIQAQNTNIEVLGTSFNFRAYPDEDIQQTTLIEGSLQVSIDDNISLISPTEQHTYSKSSKEIIIKNVDTNIYTSWKDGVFIFNSQPLEDILRNISRWYDIQVLFEKEELKNYIFSGRLKKYNNANQLLEVFEKTGNLKFEKRDDFIIVKQCNN